MCIRVEENEKQSCKALETRREKPTEQKEECEVSIIMAENRIRYLVNVLACVEIAITAVLNIDDCHQFNSSEEEANSVYCFHVDYVFLVTRTMIAISLILAKKNGMLVQALAMLFGRRGRVAPQNTFISSLTKLFQESDSSGTCYLLANARIVHFPVVYVAQQFTSMLGYSKTEVQNQSALCHFMAGAMTDETELKTLEDMMVSGQSGHTKIMFYQKNSRAIWLRVDATRIQNDVGELLFYLMTFHDITSLVDQTRAVDSHLDYSGKFSLSNLALNMGRSTRNRKTSWRPRRIPGQEAVESDANITPDGQSSSFKLDLVPGNGDLAASHGTSKTSITPPGIAGTGAGRPPVLAGLPPFRHEKPRTENFVQLHYSTFKVIWDWFIFILIFYTLILVPFVFTIGRSYIANIIPVVILDTVVDMFFLIDILFNYHTTFVAHDGTVIVDIQQIRNHYSKYYLTNDLISSIPYDVFIVIQSISSSILPDALNVTRTTEYEYIIATCQVLKILRLFRIGRLSRISSRFFESSFSLLLLMLSLYIVISHWLACIWFLIGREDLLNGNSLGWMSRLANNTNSPYHLTWQVDYPDQEGSADASNSLGATTHLQDTVENSTDFGGNLTSNVYVAVLDGGPPVVSLYVTSLYFTLTCMTSIGFGNVSPETDAEKVFACFMMIVTSLVYAAIFGHVTTIIHNMTTPSAKYHETLASVKAYMKSHEIPTILRERILDYLISKNASTKGVDQADVLAACPKDMRADICVHLNKCVFNKCSAFRLASDGCLRSLALAFEMLHSAPGDFIFRKGEKINELCFIVTGSLEVLQDGEVLAFMGEGDCFGNGGWRDSGVAKSAVHVRALTYANIHFIHCDKLKRVLDFYKAFAQTFYRNLVLTYDLSRRTMFYKLSESRFQTSTVDSNANNDSCVDRNFSLNQVMLLRRAVKQFKRKLNTTRPSSAASSGGLVKVSGPISSIAEDVDFRSRRTRTFSAEPLLRNAQRQSSNDVSDESAKFQLRSRSPPRMSGPEPGMDEIRSQISDILNQLKTVEMHVKQLSRVANSSPN